MFLKEKIEIPNKEGKIVINRNKYVMYEIDRKYDNKKKYNVPIRVSVGKVTEDGKMIPNSNYIKYFYDSKISKESRKNERSSCIRIGTYILIKKIIEEKKLNEILEKVFGEYAGLIIDLASFMIVEESNAN